MVLIRIIVLHQLTHNVYIKVKYVKSAENTLADLLFRLRISEFKRKAKGINKYPSPIPKQIWPIDKIWLN